MHNKELQCCRICGLFYPDFFPWGEAGKDPSHDICDCCGIEFGYEDSTVDSCRVNRKAWIEKGADWFNPEYRPKTWDLKTQLKNIPIEFYQLNQNPPHRG